MPQLSVKPHSNDVSTCMSLCRELVAWLVVDLIRPIWIWSDTCCNIGYMMTSSNGNIFRVTGPLCGEFTGPGEFPTQRPVTRSFDVFFDLRLHKRLSKEPWGWWFETPSWSLWRQCNVSLNSCDFHNTCNLQPPVVVLCSWLWDWYMTIWIIGLKRWNNGFKGRHFSIWLWWSCSVVQF